MSKDKNLEFLLDDRGHTSPMTKRHENLPLPSPAQQIGGSHYKDKAIQPIEYAVANKLDLFQQNVVKYITRWRDKGGVEDLRKARHYLDMYIDCVVANPNWPKE